MVWVPAALGCGMGEPPPVTLPSGAVSAKKLTSVGVKYGTVKREKLLLHNRMK